MKAETCDGWEIEVINFGKYNPRSDSKVPTWFRFESDIALGPGFHGLNCEIKWVWVIVLSLVSKKNGEVVTWNSGYVESISGIGEPAQRKALEIFEKFVRLRVTRKVTSEVSSLRTDERTDGRTTSPAKRPPATLPKIAEIWNLHCGDLRKVKSCSTKRTKAALARWGEVPQEEFWIDVVRKVAASPFLRGERPSKDHPNWKADFDWIIAPDNANKVFEGKYDEEGPPRNPPPKKKFFPDAASAIAELGGTLAPT